MFEKHKQRHHFVDDLHVRAISNPEEAAHIAALKLVMNTNLREKLSLLDTEKKNEEEYIKSIINQHGMQHLLDDIIRKHAEMSHARAETHQQYLGRSV